MGSSVVSLAWQFAVWTVPLGSGSRAFSLSAAEPY